MPFHDLSVETACEIFLQADRTTPARLPDPKSIALVVTSVCKSWRNTAIFYQPLWMVYHVTGSALVKNGSTFLARAGNLPVYAILATGPLHNKWVYNLFTTRQVGLPSFPYIQCLIPCQGPSYFTINNGNWYNCPFDAAIDNVTLKAGFAHMLAQGIPPRVSRHARLDNATTLTLSVLTMDLGRCLAWMPNIIRLTLFPTDNWPGAFNSSNTTTPIIMPHLEHFTLTQSRQNEFYGGIIAPVLVTLELELGDSSGLELRHFDKMTSQISYISFSGLIFNLSPKVRHFPSMRNVTILRMDVFLEISGRPCPEGDLNPLKLLQLMKMDPHVLPNLREIHTNKVWFQKPLDLLRDMHGRDVRNPPLTLNIFYKCASPAEPIRRFSLIEGLITAKIVYLFRQYS